MKLYHDPRSRSVRPLVVLEELGVPYELVSVSLERGEQRSSEHRSRHPLGLLPVLVDDDDLAIFESVAICQHLADRHRDRVALCPAPDAPDRPAYYQWCAFVLGALEPAMNRAYLEHLEGPVPPGLPALVDVLEVLDRAVGATGHLLPSGYSVADVLIGCTLVQVTGFGVALPAALDTYLTRLRARPAFVHAFGAGRSPTAPRARARG